MKVIEFSTLFDQPFLVRSGLVGDGLDARGRSDAAVPASSLKGAMRASATSVLGLPENLIELIFGTIKSPSPWAWTDAGPRSSFIKFSRPRVRIDPESGVAKPEALTSTEEYWQTEPATFSIEQMAALPDGRLTDDTAILQACAWGVTAMGSWRNRSMGTVTIRPVDPLPDLADRVANILEIRS